MYIEKRKEGKSIKYYLVHSYRENNKVQKIRKYIGSNLKNEELNKRKEVVKKKILLLLEELETKVFNFSLTKNQIEKLNKYNEQIKVYHLEDFNWKQFTENFVYHTNAIEGSTVTLEEVKEILEKRRLPYDEEEKESRAVSKAVEFIRTTKDDLSLELIKKLHKICFEETKSFAGNFRNVEVVIKNSRGEIVHVGVKHKELNLWLKDLIDFYYKNKNKFKPLVLSAIIHNQFEHIHPFQDGNGRVGRLLLNFILIKNKYPPINILLEDRAGYYESLQEYSKKDNLKPTLKFLIKQYNKMLKGAHKKKN